VISQPNTIVWIALAVLSLASFSLGARNGAFHGAHWILLLALGKALLVGFRFMELRTAHPAWRCGFVGLLGILTALLFGLAHRFG
jgi:Prokaryotic Cytochrome C oxidase subunit IV